MVTLFRSDGFDAIAISEPLLDMAATQLALQIRNFPNYQAVPLILLQARPQSLPQLNILTNQVKILQKPIRRSRFYNAIAQFLLPDPTNNRVDDKSDQLTEVTIGEKNPLRILLAEDIPLNQKVALQMLSTYGYDADVVSDGKATVKAVQEQSYDLVFMDVQMPEMDGLEATQKIRSSPNIQQPRIVAMTAHAMPGDRAECLAAGMDDYVSKPIRKRDLAAALRQCSPLGAVPKVEDKGVLLAKSFSHFPTLDTDILEGVDSEHSFLKEVCETFLNDAPDRIGAIQSAIDQSDALALEKAAHALKSLCGCVGAMHLFEICRSMEAIGKRDRLGAATTLMTQVTLEYAKLESTLQTYKNNL
ncbi:MAG: response regulator [Phormidesmis sp.]